MNFVSSGITEGCVAFGSQTASFAEYVLPPFSHQGIGFERFVWRVWRIGLPSSWNNGTEQSLQCYQPKDNHQLPEIRENVCKYSTLPGTVHILAFPCPFSILILHKPNQLASFYSFCHGLAYFVTSCDGQIQSAVQTFLPIPHAVIIEPCCTYQQTRKIPPFSPQLSIRVHISIYCNACLFYSDACCGLVVRHHHRGDPYYDPPSQNT